MEKGFKTLRGVRVMLSIPKKEESVIKLDPETQKELDRKFVETFKSLEVYAVGDAVDFISKGDRVYVPTEELQRGTFVDINGEQKLIVNSLSVAIIW